MSASELGEVTTGLLKGSGYELAFTPALLALGGLWIDGRLGTTPVFTVGLAVLAFVTVCLRLYYGYRDAMSRLVVTGPKRRTDRGPDADDRPVAWLDGHDERPTGVVR